MPTAKISSLGCYVPPGVLTNQDLERMVDTSNQWIVDRTGVQTRHIASKEVATSDLAVQAARIALDRRGISALELDAVIVCTVTPDMLFPATACLVQDRLGAKRAWGFDLIAACSGFVYGLTTAAHLVAGGHRKVLVVGADTMSRVVDYKDRNTCILFGDGAGAMLIEPAAEGEGGLIGFANEIDGSGGEALKMPAGGSRIPASLESVQQKLHYVHQDGQQVFKYAVRKMEELCRDVLDRNGLVPGDVNLFIPHQANKRIITAVAERLGFEQERVIVNIDRFGNTIAATIPLATQDALNSGRLKQGDLVLFASVGAGFTAGVNLWRWV